MALLPSAVFAAVAPNVSTIFASGSTAGARANALFEVVGWERTARAVFRLADSLAGNASSIDRAALGRMVDLARSRVPQDTGLLLSGIEGIEDAEGFEFRASAARSEGNTADYARFVEFGTEPGDRPRRSSGRASSIDIEGNDTSSARRAARRKGHPGTEAQPFFWPSAREVLADLSARHREAMLASIDAEGLS
jgi:hypothetical protein